MRDVRELVRRKQLAPHPEVADLFARIGRGGKQDDRRRVQRSEGGTVRVVGGIIDDDVHAPGREIPNDEPHLFAHPFHTPGECERPGSVVFWKMKNKVLGLDRSPIEPGTYRLRLGTW